MSLLIGGVTYSTVKIGAYGRRLHLAIGRGSYRRTYCGRLTTPTTQEVVHGAEDEALCDNCDACARAAREGRTL